MEFDWGDESNSGWLGPIESGEEISSSHIWNSNGNYEIRVKAKDLEGAQSEWSDPLTISMPKTKSLYEFNQWLLRLIQRFPIPKYFI